MLRRSLLVSCLGAVGFAQALAGSQGRTSASGALRLGADFALMDSGFARALQQGFVRDTGLALQVVGGAALALLDALAAGELDACMTNAAGAETRLEKEGLAHDRRAIASGEFILVGPVRTMPREFAALPGNRSVAEALAWLNETAAARAGAVVFLSANDGSGAHVAEQEAWRLARIAPRAPWYLAAAPGRLIAQARANGAFAIVERGAWDAHGGAPLAILVEGDRQLAEEIHAMRSFRSPHPAGKIFVAWIAGPRGRSIVAKQPSYRVPVA